MWTPILPGLSHCLGWRPKIWNDARPVWCGVRCYSRTVLVYDVAVHNQLMAFLAPACSLGVSQKNDLLIIIFESPWLGTVSAGRFVVRWCILWFKKCKPHREYCFQMLETYVAIVTLQLTRLALLQSTGCDEKICECRKIYFISKTLYDFALRIAYNSRFVVFLACFTVPSRPLPHFLLCIVHCVFECTCGCNTCWCHLLFR